MKIFLSLPMKDVPWPEIEYNLLCMKERFAAAAESKYGFSPDTEIEFVDNLYAGEDGVPSTILHEPVWYLHKALEKLADCDIALFHSDWEKANGCVIEHAVCTRYNIPIYYCDSVKDTNTVEAWDATWTWGGKERPKKEYHYPERYNNGHIPVDPQSHYKKALKNAFEEAEWFFTGVMNEMNERDIQDCHDMVNAIVDAAVLKYEWKKSILEDKDGEA